MKPRGGDRRRAAPAAVETSDVTRFRAYGAALLVLTLTCVGVLALRSGPSALVTPGPLARPHESLACANCHADERPASTSCSGCHGAHPSARSAHAALARQGELACGGCHAVHRSEAGLAFESDGSVSHYGTGFERTIARARGAGPPPTPGENPVFVPLVSREACARCHDLARATDPAWACFAGAAKGAYALCFDEHRRPAERSGARAAERDAAVERARELAPRLSGARLASFASSGASLLVSALAAGLVIFIAKRRARRAKSPRSLPLATPAAGIRRLPVVDATRCLGCHACVDACPYDVLEMVRYVAVPTRLEQCCGAGSCLVVCPNGSLELREGAAPATGPQLSARLESLDKKGIFLAGDVSGGSLIRSALEQGVKVAAAVAGELALSPYAARKRQRPDGSDQAPFDLVVVGAGPAGLAAGLAAKERDLAVILLEQASIGESIRRFSREKLVLDTPPTEDSSLPLWIGDAKKEDLLRRWLREVHARSLDVREGARVVGIDRLGEGSFRVRAVRPDASELVIATRRVVIASGRRGSPRKLEATVPESALGRVHYELSDARAFAGSRTLVVGLGDVAMETALALALQPRTNVTVVHRGSGFSRGRQKNIEALGRMVAEGRIGLLFDTTVKTIRPQHLVVISTAAERTLPYDALFVHIGSEADDDSSRFWLRP
jgi:thioredoxin reductase/NAD-dependent dihydropyrimidine dehydrogenase PreA subunit